MRKTRSTYHRLTDWLLMLVIAFAPLQGAFSAFNDTCEHEVKVAATDTGSHATAGDMSSHDFSVTSPAQGCCQQDCNCNGCGGACKLMHASPFVPSSDLMFLNNAYNTYEPRHMTFHIGRAVPTLFRPPRTSV